MAKSHLDYLMMVAGTESLQGGDTGGDNSLDNGGAGGGTIDTDNIEAAVEQARADTAEAQVVVEQAAQAAEEAAEVLEEHEEVLAELVEEVAGVESMRSGATTFNGMAFADRYNRCVKLNAQLGGRDFNRCGAESLNDLATAKMFSVAGVEGFMDTIKAGASKAIEFIKGIFNSMINFFVGLKSTADGLERQAKTLAATISSKEPKSKIKLGSWNIGCDYGTAGLRGIDGILHAGVFDLISSSLPAFMDLSKKLDGIDVGQFRTQYKKVTDDIKELAKAAGKPNVNQTADKTSVLMVHAGFRVFASFNEKFETEAEAVAAARSIKLTFGKTDDAAKFTKGESDIKASKAQLESTLKGVHDYVAELRGSKVAAKFSKAERDRVIGTLNVQIKGDHSEGDAKRESAKKAIDLCKAIYVSASTLTSSVDRLYIYLANQILGAVKAHF